MRPCHRRVPLVLLLAVGSALAAGGDGQAAAPGGPAPGTTTGTPATGDDDLAIALDRGDGGPVEHYRLTCGGTAGGSLPGEAAACAHLAGLTDPFAPLPADQVCAQLYGGPETAQVTGRWHGEPVDLRLSRTDSCRTAQWSSLGPLLPGPVR